MARCTLMSAVIRGVLDDGLRVTEVFVIGVDSGLSGVVRLVLECG